MPKSTLELIEEFKSFIQYVENLKSIGEEYWNKPISDGKWTVKDIICHIMLWDKYFYEEGTKKIKVGEPVTVRHLNFDEFNANAIVYAKTRSKDEIIEECMDCRVKIIQDISGLPEDDYLKEYRDGDKKKFSIRGYLRGFIPHDKHHKKQIEKFLKEAPPMEKNSIQTIDDYIAPFPDEIQEKLKSIRSLIKDTVPAAQEKISYGMPTFTLHGNLVHFAAFKNHIGFYPTPSGTEAFRNELSAYKGAKGSVQFPLDKPIPLDLVRKIVEFRVAENMDKASKVKRKKDS